jgi:c-di-GMP-binding flagellar brake protein YcgR
VKFVILQSEFWKRDDPTGAIIAGIVILIAILSLIVYKVIKGDFKPVARTSPSLQFKGGKFKRAARGSGLSERQVSFLADYGRRLQTSNADFVFQNPSALDAFLKKVYREIESREDSEEKAEEKKAYLFEIRSFFDGKNASGGAIGSTRKLREGLVFSFITPSEEHHPSKVIAVEAEALLVEMPTDAMEHEIRFPWGMKLHCAFYTQAQQGCTFDSRVIGYKTRNGKSLLCLSHTDRVTSLPNRQHLRRRLSQDCSFSPVKIVMVEDRRKQVKKSVVQKRTIPGTIEDISAGGMSVRTANPSQQNEFIKVNFDLHDGQCSLFAKVVRLERQKAIGGVMHLQFVKMNRKTLNSVYNLVYGYED